MTESDNNEIDEGLEELSAEGKARKEAVARRQKILAKAGNRLDMVSGIVPTVDDANETTENEDIAAAAAAAAAPEEGGEKKMSPSKAAKMAALRRRRFKKKDDAPSPTKDAEATTTTEASTIIEEEDNNAKPTATTAEESPEVSTQVEAQVKDEPKAEVPISVEETTTTKPAEEEEEVLVEKTEGDDDEPKKKYMGVAKMRRKMIKERYAKQQEEEGGDADGATADHSDVVPIKPKKLKIYHTMPIAMHVVTVLLLFLAGLEIGLQQANVEYMASDLTVHTKLAPQQEMLLLTKISGWTGGSRTKDAPSVLDQVVQESYLADGQDEEDEFQEHVEEDSKPENIDPLFQVDLDKYTRGPGFIMMAGRFVVACHRANLAVFYYFPISIVHRIQNIILSLIQSPPMMCLVALAIRQFVGKVILGARLPEFEKEEQGKDVLGMVKNFVTNFLLKAFPTVANLYDAWSHLRSDMYVILCGLFVGIAWHHQFGALPAPNPDEKGPSDPPGIGSDEL